jgi:hypothetical protein|tara:strand:- start:131 stop:580 length:450 start_codon:yes stop_codon:yes gene_type:complete
MKEVFKKPYIYWLMGIFIVYLVITIYISEFYITAKHIPHYIQTIEWSKLIASILLALIIASLVSINSVYAYIKHKRRNVKKEEGLICVATIGGFATGVCPACVTGLFPIIFSYFGLSFSFLSLPFQGLEIQVLIIVILVASLYFLQKNE